MRKTPLRRVAILYPTTIPWIARCVAGLRRYAYERASWRFFSSPTTLRGSGGSTFDLRSMEGWSGDAIVTATNDEHELRYARRMAIPVVNLAGGLPTSCGVPRVMVDHKQAGRLAADHLLGRGLRDFAFFGWTDLWYSEQRSLGFGERVGEDGFQCDVFLQTSYANSGVTWPQRIAGLAKWLASLPRPTGVFAVNDYGAQLLIEACYEAELRMPEEIAVIGMDNDETICEHCVPTLTSVSRNSEQVGWEAAALLDRLMRGEPAPADDLILMPDGVVARQSTEMLYCTDPATRRALDYMRAHLDRPSNIEPIAKHAGVSKRTLETRFRENFRTSPHEFLTKLRVRRAQALLQTPHKRSIAQTALECGFGTVSGFYAAFQRLSGESPATFRKRHRNKL